MYEWHISLRSEIIGTTYCRHCPCDNKMVKKTACSDLCRDTRFKGVTAADCPVSPSYYPYLLLLIILRRYTYCFERMGKSILQYHYDLMPKSRQTSTILMKTLNSLPTLESIGFFSANHSLISDIEVRVRSMNYNHHNTYVKTRVIGDIGSFVAAASKSKS